MIRTRREGGVHADSEVQAFVDSVTRGEIPDYQVSAWLMASQFQRLSLEETATLTLAMAASGERINLAGLPKPWVDKHSSGGVGDKTTIALVPLLAACGLTTVKMSGRGLGITGGTIDKLESIPGFRTDLSPEEMVDQAKRIGCALAGQTARLAPADGILYALRDATETVDNIPLIVASILSKKIAGGAEVVVLDVKCGTGAFMRTKAEAQTLADWLTKVGYLAGLKVRTIVSDMNQPLGRAVGNALEVAEALDNLQPEYEPQYSSERRFTNELMDIAALTIATAFEISDALARERVKEALRSGKAWQKAEDWIRAQGGQWEPALPSAAFVQTVEASTSGVVTAISASGVGQFALELGAGRQQKDDEINPAVGIELLVSVGDAVQKGQPLARAHLAAERPLAQLAAAISVE